MDGCEASEESKDACVHVGELCLSSPATLDCQKADKLYTCVVANEVLSEFGHVFLLEKVQVYVGAVVIGSNVNFYFADWRNAATLTMVDSQTFLLQYMPKRSHWRGKLD